MSRRIVILAGRKSHGPAGNGIHDYPAQARLIEDCLRRGPLGGGLGITRAEDDAWPAAAVAAADCLVVVGDGRDGDLPYAEAGHLASPERIAQVEAAVARGAGVVVLHFSTFAAERDLARALRWQGAAFQWEQGGKRDWHSRITWATGMPDVLAAGHPVLRGVAMGRLHEEFYHRLAFHPAAVPLVAVRALPGADPGERTVAWALERPGGGRGFGTTMAHSLDSLRHDGLRTLLLNGIAWAAGCEPPDAGLGVPFAEREEVDHRLGLGPAPAPIRVAVLAGNAAHRWHNWPESTAALLRAWGDDARITARVHTDPADLASALDDRDVLVLNWVNWEDPAGMPAPARAALQAFVAHGGGVFIHHFANGACHPSLPGAAASDWPWYRTLVRRVWEHRPLAPGASSHDRFRAFEVRPCGGHPLVAGMGAFTVEDELYWRQHGDEPIEALMTARSQETGADEPLVWSYELGPARVVQSLLGHSARTYEPAAMRALACRAVAWCAQRALHGAAPA
ncbi:MAG: ThuA domain-containing protein [Planctomycetes bacterium]|nr:ThuA domain-containing protein [Planctomycetota bacterium]